MKTIKDKQKGNITIEAALIFPVIFFSIIAIMFIGIFLYQQILLQSLANNAVERGAATWDNPKRDISTGFVDISELNSEGIYWRIFDFKKGEKKTNLEDYINEKMDNYSILNGVHEIADVDLKNYLIYKKLIITVESKYKNPAGSIMKNFGFDDHITISVNTEAVINEPVEFIRNTDFILDIVEDMEGKNPTVAKIGSSTREILSKTKEFLTNVFELGK